jgi:hypothetical protein
MTILVLLALAVALGYGAACAFWPFRAFPRCSGTGKRRSPGGKAWRRCGRCSGTGRRVRLGWRVYEVFTRD